MSNGQTPSSIASFQGNQPIDELQRHWEQQQYMAALTAAWRLPPLYNYHAVVTRITDLTLQGLVHRASREALTTWTKNENDRQQAISWVNELLSQFPPPPGLINHGDGSDAEAVRQRLIRASLESVWLVLTQNSTSVSQLTTGLRQIAEENNVPLGWLQDVVQEALSLSSTEPHGRQPQRAISLNALLVGEARGIVATLTLELMEPGSGSLYPASNLAFIRRDPTFRQAEDNARLFTNLSSMAYDVRWSLRRRDGQAVSALTGPSMGLTLALGLIQLLAGELDTLEMTAIGGTASVGADGTLHKVGGLWQKLGEHTIDLARRGLLRTIVVATEQEDVPSEYLGNESEGLQVLQAQNVQDAVRQLQDQFQPRRAVQQYEYEHCQYFEILDKTVPIAAHYQVLPLLQVVKRERLPHLRVSTTRNAFDQQEARLQGLRDTDIVRWEEALREEQISYTQLSLEQAFFHFRSANPEEPQPPPRFVVLGPPGCGKTTLTQYLAWQAAQNGLPVLGRSLVPARIRLREWEAWVTQTTTPERGFAAYLAVHYQDLPNAPTVDSWRRWLQRGEVLLLLDGLDEIEEKPTFVAALKATLQLSRNCPTIITCRTVSFDQHQSLCPDFTAFTLAGFEEPQRDTFIRMFPASHPEQYDPEAVSQQLRATPSMAPLAANPLLLSIMCYVIDHARSPLLPTTRGDLYKKALETLLAHTQQRVEVRYPGEKPAIEEKLFVAQRAALYLFLQEEPQLTFTGEELRHAFRRALIAEGYAEGAVAPWANAFRTDFVHNSGILRGNAEQGFFFLHLTVHEFLAAAAIAQLANEEGWETRIERSGVGVTLRQLVEHKAWDPRWQEIITFLAGQLTIPLPLLTLLTSEKRDDIFRHRLALAARCLPELRETTAAGQIAIQERITTTAFSFWLQHETKGTAATIPHFTRILPALGQVNNRRESNSLLLRISQQLRETKAEVRLSLIGALGRMGASVAQHPQVLAALVATLRDTDAMVRAETATAFRRIGKAIVAHPGVLPALEHAAQHDPNWFVRFGATKTLQHLQMRETLEPTLSDTPAHCQRRENESPTQSPGATTAIFPSLADLTAALFSQDPTVRVQATLALGQYQERINQYHEALEALIQIALHDKDSGVRTQAITTLATLGATQEISQRKKISLALAQALQRDRDGNTRARAARSLGALVKTQMLDEEELSAVFTALRDEDANVRAEAAAALGEIMAQGIRMFRRWWKNIECKNVETLADENR